MVDGVEPVTRFSSAEAAEGCWTLTAPPWPTEKPCQFTTAPLVDCCIVMVDGVCEMVTEPAATAAAGRQLGGRGEFDPRDRRARQQAQPEAAAR